MTDGLAPTLYLREWPRNPIVLIRGYDPFTTTPIELKLNRELLSLTARMKSADSSALGRKAVAHLKKVDPVLGQVIDKVGVYKGWPASNGTHFDAVARSIVFQQLSGKAASTIHGRFQGLYGGRTPLPAELATTSDEQLRAVGLSRQKSAYLKDLGAKVASGELPIETLHELTDEEVISALTQVKGIGRWTAQMFMMFRLGRPDVLPDLDLGVQKGIQRAYRLRKLPTPERVKKIGAKWAPYRTIASWYLWRLLDTPVLVPRSGG